MTEAISLAYGAVGAGVTFIVGLIITWFYVFPWAMRRWMHRAAMDKDSKERQRMVEIGSLFMEVATSYLTEELIKYDPKARQYVIDERMKPIMNGVKMYFMQVLNQQISQFQGRIKKGINNAVGNTDTNPLAQMAKMAGIDLGGDLGALAPLLGNFIGSAEGGGGLPGGESATSGFTPGTQY